MKENLLRGTHFQERLRSQKQQCSPKQIGAKHLKCGNSTHVAFFQRLGLFPALYVQLSGSKNISKKQRFSQSSFPTPSEVGHLLREIWNRANDSSFFSWFFPRKKLRKNCCVWLATWQTDGIAFWKMKPFKCLQQASYHLHRMIFKVLFNPRAIMLERKWFKRLVRLFFLTACLFILFTPPSDQGCVNDLPQVNHPDNQQPSQPAEQHWHLWDLSRNGEHRQHCPISYAVKHPGTGPM